MYKRLRVKLYEHDITFEMLAKELGVSNTYVTNRFSCKYPFSMDDVHVICRLLSIPHEEVMEYFPERRKTA